MTQDARPNPPRGAGNAASLRSQEARSSPTYPIRTMSPDHRAGSGWSARRCASRRSLSQRPRGKGGSLGHVKAIEFFFAIGWAAFWIYWLAAAFSMTRGRVPWSSELGIRAVIAIIVILF